MWSCPSGCSRRPCLPGARAGYESLLHDNYESPLSPLGSRPAATSTLDKLTGVLKVSVSEFLAGARNLESPDELSVFIARRLMRQFAPSLLWITLHDIDIAHAGTFSLYVDAIRRTDRLCAEIWKMIQSEAEYAGRTTLFVLPDFGRDSDETPGGNGFQHHRTGMRARGRRGCWRWVPGIRENVLIDRPIDSMDLVPTLGAYFGFSPRFARGQTRRRAFLIVQPCSPHNSSLSTSRRIHRSPGKSPSADWTCCARCR